MVSVLYQATITKLILDRGESGVGTWTIVIRDTQVNDRKGTFTDWHLKLWGESIDASKANPLPMPTDEDDDDHDATTTATPIAITTSLPPHPDATKTAIFTSVPDDHPERPVKPSNTNSGSGSSPTSTQPAAAETTTAGSSWLPSFLPTFGVSSRTQAWIYGALGLIVTFCAGLGAWLWVMRRRRLRNNPRDTYEFEPLNPDEAAGLNNGREKGTRRRGGELYDAFAGGSDDEAFEDGDHSSLVSTDSDEESEESDEEAHEQQQGSKPPGSQPQGRP